MSTRSSRGRRLPVLMIVLTLLAGALSTQTIFAAKPTAPSVVDYAQCANGAPGSTSLACPDGWINGILQASNSHYAEDQVTPQRAEILVPAGSALSHSLTFTYQTRKGSAMTHAYDSLATWNYTQTAADRNQGLNAADVVGGAALTAPIPSDSTVIAPFVGNGATSAHELPQADRQFTVFGLPAGSSLSVSAPVHDCTVAVPSFCADASKDDYASVTVTFSQPNTTSARKIQFLFGGHLALGSQGGSRTWGLGNGASDISGGPYHIKWVAMDGASVGNRDNQIMGSAILFQDTSVTTLLKKASDNSSLTDGSQVAIGTAVYDTATLAGSTATASGTATYRYQLQTAAQLLAGTPVCDAGTLISTETVANGVVGQSDNVTLNAAGTYEFWVVYSGDANNNTSTSTCGSETLVMPKADPSFATTQKLLPNDSASLSGATSTAGGSITFSLFAPGDATCAGTPAFTQTVGVSGNGSYATTNGQQADPAAIVYAQTEGTWRWLVTYTGDANNNGFTLACGHEAFTIDNNTTN
jgi:hypothetical protein